MSPNAEKNCMKMKIRDVENVFRYRRIPYPKRSVELIALIAISCTFFLFMHTKNLNTRLREMEVKLQPSEFSALGLTGEHHVSGGDSRHPNDINTLHGTYQYLKSTGQIHTLDANALNNTRNAEVDIMFFNRVPKVGSQSLMELMKRMAVLHGYTAQRDKPKVLETILVSPNKEFEVADEIMELKEPAVFSKHIAYINFTHLDYPKPIYINLVRDPIERIVSWFYYIRAPWYLADRKKHFPDLDLPSVEWLKKDFGTCLRKHDPECLFEQETKRYLGDHRRQMLFFCGQDDAVCLPFNSYHAMQRAKRTVEKDYAVVGTWEETNVTLAVLEKYIPRFFKHASEVYHKQPQQQRSVGDASADIQKKPVKMDLTVNEDKAECEPSRKRSDLKEGRGGMGRVLRPFNSEEALQRAKRNVEEEYAVVGTWEDANITLAVLEMFVPRFFKNAKVAYYLGHDRLSSVNKNKVKKGVSDEVREILRRNFTREIEFYEFCKQRLYRQYAAISPQIGGDDDYMLLPEND